jgi:hypothetical protein
VIKTATSGRVTIVMAISPRTPVSVIIWTRIPTQVKVPIKGRSWWTVFLDILRKFIFTGESNRLIKAAAINIIGNPTTGSE